MLYDWRLTSRPLRWTAQAVEHLHLARAFAVHEMEAMAVAQGYMESCVDGVAWVRASLFGIGRVPRQ
eukprot:scaffold239940_cov28-Tisochrysis_lutea.AAC.2